MSDIEKMIHNKIFSYEAPYFYNNQLALRCELGVGNDDEYLINAKKRAAEIYSILFPHGVDVFFFDDNIYDYDFGMNETVSIDRIVSIEKNRLKFSLWYQKKYKHVIVRDIPFDREDNEDLIRRNRIICYPNKSFHALEIINSQIDSTENSLIHFVSFENECILTVYDDRGCDIVFFNQEHFKKNYPLLEKYFLAYDLDLMKQRLKENE